MKREGGGGVEGVGRPPPPLFLGANFLHFIYKVLGKRSLQIEPFKKIAFITTPPPLEKFLPTSLVADPVGGGTGGNSLLPSYRPGGQNVGQILKSVQNLYFWFYILYGGRVCSPSLGGPLWIRPCPGPETPPLRMQFSHTNVTTSR